MIVKRIWELYHKYEEIIHYLIVGGLTTLISLAVKYGLLFTVLDASNAIELQIAVIASWVLAVLFAYFANRIFVFHSKSKQYLKEVSGFVAGRIATLVMEMVIMWFFVTLLGLDSDLWVVIWTVVCQILVIVGNYVISKLYVFKK